MAGKKKQAKAAKDSRSVRSIVAVAVGAVGAGAAVVWSVLRGRRRSEDKAGIASATTPKGGATPPGAPAST